jgi:macrolide transport system ATP-binding/permease protein
MRLIELQDVTRTYVAGDTTLKALDHINLSIDAGEMIAVMGPSGSGKSTLMNILGTLDQATSGRYCLDGTDVAGMNADLLAILRSQRFGFIFQGYQLLGGLSAVQNVELPAIYARRSGPSRKSRALALLARLGLAFRAQHRPSQLSGGQQQRVAVARALMNGGEILFADEPTGALDSESGKDMLALLRQINESGSTIILVTHDPLVAAHAHRVIELCDGRIVRDVRNETRPVVSLKISGDEMMPEVSIRHAGNTSMVVWLSLWNDALRGAVSAIKTSKIRSFLTMLGVVIGVTSVSLISIVGDNTRQSALKLAQTLDAGSVIVSRGEGRDSRSVAIARYFSESDFNAISRLGGVKNVLFDDSPHAHFEGPHGVDDGNVASVSGRDIGKLASKELVWGRRFSAADLDGTDAVAMIDDSLANTLFGRRSFLGVAAPALFVDHAALRVVGVVKGIDTTVSGGVRMWVPVLALQSRLGGLRQFNSFTVQVEPAANENGVRDAIERLLTILRGRHDFRLEKVESNIKEQLEQFTFAITLGLSAIGAISMLVGGIGVMNIMLVSVSERTREIGIRMAIGANRRDVGRQFVLESVVLCGFAGIIAITLTAMIVLIANMIVASMTDLISLRMSPLSVLEAVGAALAIGVIFGWYPARSAAALKPIDALARQ